MEDQPVTAKGERPASYIAAARGAGQCDPAEQGAGQCDPAAQGAGRCDPAACVKGPPPLTAAKPRQQNAGNSTPRISAVRRQPQRRTPEAGGGCWSSLGSKQR